MKKSAETERSLIGLASLNSNQGQLASGRMQNMSWNWELPNNKSLDQVLKNKYPGCKSVTEAFELVRKNKTEAKPERLSVRKEDQRSEVEVNQENYQALSNAISEIEKWYEDKEYSPDQLLLKKRLDEMSLNNVDDVKRWKHGWLKLCAGL